MRGIGRIWLAGTLACTLACASVALSAPAALASYGIAKWEAGTCKTEGCTVATPEQFYTQAAGHPEFGITDFKFNATGEPGHEFPTGNVKNVRVDLPQGLSVNPEAVMKCPQAAFRSTEVAEGTFLPSSCLPTTVVGKDIVTVAVPVGPEIDDIPLEGTVYNLEQPNGLPLEFGVAVPLGLLGHSGLYAHTLLEGGVSWSTDYHELFTIKDIPATLPLLESRLITEGDIGNTVPLDGGLITMPSACAGPQVTNLSTESYAGETSNASFTTPVGVEGCEKPPFEPSINVVPASKQSDQSDGVTVEIKLPQNPNPGHTEVNSSALRDARVSLPEGMTLNPAAANGLEACTDEQFGKGTTREVKCPAGSQVGTVAIETPDLPPGALTGNVYVGQPLSSSPESGQEYRLFIDSESARYDVAVRLEGKVIANASTGRLTTMVIENPQLPFSDFIVKLSGPHAPLANPLVCGAATSAAGFVPYTAHPTAVEAFMSFPIDFNGKGAACPSPLPFALSQSTQATPTTGGSTTSFTFNLVRPEGSQYLAKVSTTLPEGLVGKIPAVPLCDEAQANAGQCAASSQIGTATVALGSGASPLTLTGSVYLTGPYGGGPYGLSVVVPAEKVGPFDYGKIVTRASIAIDELTTRVTVSSVLPTIIGGVPLRMRTLTVAVNRPNFMINPTNCATLATETLATSAFGTSQLVSSPFQASGCNALSFKPKFSASTNAFTSRPNGASFEVAIGYPTGLQANIKSVVVRLPKQLPSRLDTLKKACPEAIFNSANPYNCPVGSYVGGATVTTPVLPKPLTGRVFFVSHGGAAFPDIDMVLGGNGVVIALVGNTNISKGITTTTFASLPDAPVSSFHMNLPYGKFSALGGHGNLCAQPLIMPTTLTGQNGVVVKQNTRIKVKGCLKVVSHRVRGHKVTLTIQAAVAGKLRVGGGKLASVGVRLRKARRITISVPLSSAGLRALKAHKPLKVTVAVRLTVSRSTSYSASTTARFR